MPFDPEPEVVLVSALQDPYNTVIAAARTCYSSRVVTPADVDKDDKARDLRDRIYEGIYDAGHHTTIQHPTFVFTLKKVSRQFIWSFLHAHPFYNSEQVSQRYVEVRTEQMAVPPLDGEALGVYTDCIERQFGAYRRLIEVLHAPTAREYYRLFPRSEERRVGKGW